MRVRAGVVFTVTVSLFGGIWLDTAADEHATAMGGGAGLNGVEIVRIQPSEGELIMPPGAYDNYVLVTLRYRLRSAGGAEMLIWLDVPPERRSVVWRPETRLRVARSEDFVERRFRLEISCTERVPSDVVIPLTAVYVSFVAEPLTQGSTHRVPLPEGLAVRCYGGRNELELIGRTPDGRLYSRPGRRWDIVPGHNAIRLRFRYRAGHAPRGYIYVVTLNEMRRRLGVGAVAGPMAREGVASGVFPLNWGTYCNGKSEGEIVRIAWITFALEGVYFIGSRRHMIPLLPPPAAFAPEAQDDYEARVNYEIVCTRDPPPPPDAAGASEGGRNSESDDGGGAVEAKVPVGVGPVGSSKAKDSIKRAVRPRTVPPRRSRFQLPPAPPSRKIVPKSPDERAVKKLTPGPDPAGDKLFRLSPKLAPVTPTGKSRRRSAVVPGGSGKGTEPKLSPLPRATVSPQGKDLVQQKDETRRSAVTEGRKASPSGRESGADPISGLQSGTSRRLRRPGVGKAIPPSSNPTKLLREVPPETGKGSK